MLGLVVWKRRVRTSRGHAGPPEFRTDWRSILGSSQAGPPEPYRTKGCDGKPSDKGLRLLQQTPKDNIEQEAPVKTNELFFQAFYSPHVWCMQAETMQQYILRREQDFKRLDTSGL